MLRFSHCVFQPGRNKFAMMNLKVIQNQEHFLFWGTDQTLYEAGQLLLVHGVLIDHKADINLAVDCRNHIDPPPFRLHWQHRRVSLRWKAVLHWKDSPAPNKQPVSWQLTSGSGERTIWVAAFRLYGRFENLSLLSYSYCITDIS